MPSDPATTHKATKPSLKTRLSSENAKETTGRIIHWLFFDVLFALLPLGIALFFHALAGNKPTEAKDITPELLFFALVISGTSMGSIQEVSKPLGWTTTLKLLFGVLLLGAIFEAICYGAVLYDREVTSGPVVFEENLRYYCQWFAAGSALVSLVTQLLTARLSTAKEGVAPKEGHTVGSH